MLGVVRIFFRAKGTNPRTVLGCLLVAGLVEGIGIATLLPLLSVAIQADIANDSLINQAVLKSLNYVGLSPELNILLWIVVAALIIKACITFVAMVLVGYATAHVSTGIRTDVVKNLLKARWSYFTAQPVGRFANSMSNDATRAGRTYEMAAEFLANSIQTGVFMLVALIMSWRLTLLAVIVGGIILLILNSLVRAARRAGQKQTDRTKHLIIYLTDVVNNVRALKAMAKEGTFNALLDRRIKLLRKALRTQVLSLQTLKALQEILIALAMGVGGHFGPRVRKHRNQRASGHGPDRFEGPQEHGFGAAPVSKSRSLGEPLLCARGTHRRDQPGPRESTWRARAGARRGSAA